MKKEKSSECKNLISRREFLQMCEAGLMGIAFFLFSPEARLLAAVKREQSPFKSIPFDGASVETGGTQTSHENSDANSQTGKLIANVTAQMRGATSVGAGGYTRSFVRWTYSHAGSTDLRATVSLRWTGETVYPPDLWSDEGGGASSYVIIGIRITDKNDGSTVNYIIKKYFCGQVMNYPIQSGSEFYQECPVLFKSGHSYEIDAYLESRADVASGKALDPNVQHTSQGGYGKASQKAEITIQEIRLRTMEPPWIQTTILAVWEANHDTYQIYEEALRRTLNKDYFAAGARVRISAGGRYDKNVSRVTIGMNGSKIIKLKDCPLSYSLSENRQQAIINLPDYSTLPLEGKSWQFTVIFDPQFARKFDDYDFILPIFHPVFGMMSDVALAANRVLFDRKPYQKTMEFKKDTKPLGVGIKTDPQHFFNLKNWYSVMPLSSFRRMIESYDSSLKYDNTMRRTGKTAPPLTISIHVPKGMSIPQFDPSEIKIKPLSTNEMALVKREFSTEPVVINSINDLWMMLVYLSSIVDITGDDLILNPNPRFLIWLNNLGERSEAYREFISSLCYMAPNGEVIKLIDLPDYFDPGLGDRGPLYLYIAGVMIPVAVFFSKRLRRWIRRTVTLRVLQEFWTKIRPNETQQINIYGFVSSNLGSKESRDLRGFKIFFDFIPKTQPWPLAEPFN